MPITSELPANTSTMWLQMREYDGDAQYQVSSEPPPPLSITFSQEISG